MENRYTKKVLSHFDKAPLTRMVLEMKEWLEGMNIGLHDMIENALMLERIVMANKH